MCFEHNFWAVLQRADSLLLFSAMLYECVTQECPEMLPTYIAIEQVTQTCINWFPECNLNKHKTLLNVYCVHDTCCVAQAVRAVSRGDLLQTFPLWQLRLVVELWNSRVMHGPAKRHDALLTSEFLPVMKNMVDVALDTWLKGETGQKMDAVWFQTTRAHFLTSSYVTWLNASPELFSCAAQPCQDRLCTTHWTITFDQRLVLIHTQSNTCFWWCGKQVKYYSW